MPCWITSRVPRHYALPDWLFMLCVSPPTTPLCNSHAAPTLVDTRHSPRARSATPNAVLPKASAIPRNTAMGCRPRVPRTCTRYQEKPAPPRTSQVECATRENASTTMFPSSLTICATNEVRRRTHCFFVFFLVLQPVHDDAGDGGMTADMQRSLLLTWQAHFMEEATLKRRLARRWTIAPDCTVAQRAPPLAPKVSASITHHLGAPHCSSRSSNVLISSGFWVHERCCLHAVWAAVTGAYLPDGIPCGVDSQCAEGSCQLSASLYSAACGDNYVDTVAGEECDCGSPDCTGINAGG